LEETAAMPFGGDPARWEPATKADVAAAGVLLALLAPFAGHTLRALSTGTHGCMLAGAALAGVVAADFVTGFLHWLCDTFFAEDTPVIGPAVIEPFREHHRDPLAMTQRAFLRVSNSNVVATCVMLASVFAWRALRGGPPSAFVDAWITSLACALWLTNQLHKWAHVPRVPGSVAWLQRARLILPPAHHARHHTAADGRAFCVTTGWLNPLMDGARVFRTAERLVRFVRPRPLSPGHGDDASI
jgi:ubiquitin-conjugating enzyme E2 variant